ncbi:hypothetical protein Cgig2_029749 [Carnegiea gigantea]|uniref:Uncharacterized protein n=1 Tax=Carnegiea gigantea TaxID=171969 RepID=A0A9Q1K2S4_9CARY|nr:hypothetical protein Cgig2_029749 [Carnegiea gigantea]
MFRLVMFLKSLKAPLQRLNKDTFHDIHNQQDKHREKLCQVQMKLHKDPLNTGLLQEEEECRAAYLRILKSSLSLMKQQTREEGNWVPGVANVLNAYYQGLIGVQNNHRVPIDRESNGSAQNILKKLGYGGQPSQVLSGDGGSHQGKILDVKIIVIHRENILGELHAPGSIDIYLTPGSDTTGYEDMQRLYLGDK